MMIHPPGRGVRPEVDPPEVEPGKEQTKKTMKSKIRPPGEGFRPEVNPGKGEQFKQRKE